MTYRNPLWASSDGVLAGLAVEGVDGVIVPDLPAGEEPSFERRAAAAGLALTFLVAPNTAPDRMARRFARQAASSTSCRATA